MLTLQELRCQLDDTDLRTKIARAAQQYVKSKGYLDVRPFGSLAISDDCIYFYYLLSHRDRLGTDLLELEVCKAEKDELGRDFVCTVTAYRESPQ